LFGCQRLSFTTASEKKVRVIVSDIATKSSTSVQLKKSKTVLGHFVNQAQARVTRLGDFSPIGYFL
jgi:hypothetical protein